MPIVVHLLTRGRGRGPAMYSGGVVVVRSLLRVFDFERFIHGSVEVAALAATEGPGSEAGSWVQTLEFGHMGVKKDHGCLCFWPV